MVPFHFFDVTSPVSYLWPVTDFHVFFALPCLIWGNGVDYVRMRGKRSYVESHPLRSCVSQNKLIKLIPE